MRLFISILIMLLLFSGCVSKPSIELVSSSVDFSNEEERLGGIGITSGEKNGEIIVPTALSYNFIFKNIGKKRLGSAENLNKQTFDYDDGIKVHIEPNEKLKAVSEEIMGVNIFNFDEEGRHNSELGTGVTGVPIIEPNQEGTYTLDFILGANKDHPEIRVLPSAEQLEILKGNAMEASLIVSIEGEEVAHFDLSNLN
ncbi:hypothetical protein [Metabacillus litoralis]|uniref:hypothetical protein n=1 Tax=Metabacillus litoralis TaxID=152268 RepID=UPI001CFCDC2D|nr:hypothetical protein [Metabacillus litoralis]